MWVAVSATEERAQARHKRSKAGSRLLGNEGGERSEEDVVNDVLLVKW